MKKRIFLVFAAVFTAALVFAQEFKLDGYVNYGLGVEFDSRDKDKSTSQGGNGGNDLMVRAAGVDSEQKGGRFRLNGAYTNANKTAGVNFRFQLQGATSGDSYGGGKFNVLDSNNDPTTDTVTVPSATLNIGGDNTYDVGLAYAYGWVRPVEMLQIKAGIVADSTFETQGPILRDDAGAGAGAGVFIKLTPISGLDVGVGAYPRSADGSNNNNRIIDIGGQTNWYNAKYTFGVAYTMPDVFKFNTSFRTFNRAGVQSRQAARAIAEVQLLMVKDLTAIVEVELDNLYVESTRNASGAITANASWADGDGELKWDAFSKIGKFNIYETFAYKLGALRFGLNAAQYIRNVPDNASGKTDMINNADKDIALRFNPWVSYALGEEGKLVPRLDLVYFMGGDRTRTGGDGDKYDRRVDLAPTYNKDEYVFNVRPSIKINFDSRNSLEIGDVVYYRKQAKGTTNNPDGKGFINNVFYIDMVVRF